MNKKLVFALALISLFTLSPLSVGAKSGCCSGHNGVNCGAGPQGNGHVVCNDGSTTSSCLYSEMVMCGGSSGSGSNTSQPKVVPPTSIPARRIVTTVPTRIPTKKPTPTAIPTMIPQPTETVAPTLAQIPTITETLKNDVITNAPVNNQNVSKPKVSSGGSFFAKLFAILFGRSQ